MPGYFTNHIRSLSERPEMHIKLRTCTEICAKAGCPHLSRLLYNAKIVSSLAELNSYKYSGHSVLMAWNKNNWQDVNYVLSVFGETVRTARKKYLAYVESGMNQGRRPELVGGGLIRSVVCAAKRREFGKTPGF
jgi:hypothetical protein